MAATHLDPELTYAITNRHAPYLHMTNVWAKCKVTQRLNEETGQSPASQMWKSSRGITCRQRWFYRNWWWRHTVGEVNGVLPSWGCHHQVLRMSSWEQQHCPPLFGSGDWGLKTRGQQGQFLSRARGKVLLPPSLLGLQMAVFCATLRFAFLLCLHLHPVLPAWASVSKCPLFYEDISHTGLPPHPPWPHFNVISSVKSLSPSKVTFWTYLYLMKVRFNP